MISLHITPGASVRISSNSRTRRLKAGIFMIAMGVRRSCIALDRSRPLNYSRTREFEGDAAKSDACFAERGVDFAYVLRVFLDPDRLDATSERDIARQQRADAAAAQPFDEPGKLAYAGRVRRAAQMRTDDVRIAVALDQIRYP